MTLAPGDVRIDVTLTNGTFQGLNVWHGTCNSASPPTVAEAQTLVDRIRDFYASLINQIAIGTNIVIGSRVVAIGVEPEQFVAVTPRTTTGTHAGDVLPLQTCLTLKLRTPNATRRGRGHVFLWPFAEDQNTIGAPVSTLVTAINNAATVLPNTPFDTPPFIGVLSRIGTGTPAAPSPHITPLQSAVSSTQWSVLRSRRK